MSKFKVGEHVSWSKKHLYDLLDTLENSFAVTGVEEDTDYVSIMDTVGRIWSSRQRELAIISQTETPSAGIKHDQQKPLMSSIPKEAMWQMGAALGYGAKKYGDGNFRKGMHVSRQLSAAVRHIYQHLSGENLDEESGVTHLGHALASLAMACYTIEHHPDLDDRFEGDKQKHEVKKDV